MRSISLLSLAALWGVSQIQGVQATNGLPDFLGDERPITIPLVKKLGSSGKLLLRPSRWDDLAAGRNGSVTISGSRCQAGDDDCCDNDDGFCEDAEDSEEDDGRELCAPQPSGHGPMPRKDTAEAFRNFRKLTNIAKRADTPGCYEPARDGLGLSAAVVAVSFVGAETLRDYDPSLCSEMCDKNDRCSAFNIYFERDPTLDPSRKGGCGDPPATNNIKCVLWANRLTRAMARNSGERREDFEVVIMGSNIYNKRGCCRALSQLGFAGPFESAAVPVPPDEPVGGYGALLGHTRFDYADGHGLDPALCAAACDARTEANAGGPPSLPSPLVAGAYPVCSQFVAFELHRGAVPVALVCVEYATTWDPAGAGDGWAGDAAAGTTPHAVAAYRREGLLSA